MHNFSCFISLQLQITKTFSEESEKERERHKSLMQRSQGHAFSSSNRWSYSLSPQSSRGTISMKAVLLALRTNQCNHVSKAVYASYFTVINFLKKLRRENRVDRLECIILFFYYYLNLKFTIYITSLGLLLTETVHAILLKWMRSHVGLGKENGFLKL